MAVVYTPPLDLGKDLPDFKLPGMDGKSHAMSSFKNGQPLLVMFICNHCPYVKALEDRLIQLGHDCRKLDVNVVAICSNDPKEYPEDSFKNLQKRWTEKSYPFVYLHDSNQVIAKKFGAVCTPDFFLYDKNLKLAYRGRLDDSWKEPTLVSHRELFKAIQTLHQGRAITEPQSASMGCSIKWSR
jgi:peroxiredoxin